MRRSTALMAAAALLLLVASLAVAYMSVIAYGERSEEVETRRMFRDWMAKFNKTYSSIDEEEHRYAVYKQNRRRFDKQNAAADAAGVLITHLGLNVFGDLTDEELRCVYPACARDNEDQTDSIDWRKKGRGGGRDEAVSR